jgi:hypothetical protein
MIIGIAAMVCISVCGLLSTLEAFEAIDEVNAKLPEGERFSQLGWYPTKHLRFNRAYQALCPHGNYLRRRWVYVIIMCSALLIAAWAFGMFGR